VCRKGKAKGKATTKAKKNIGSKLVSDLVFWIEKLESEALIRLEELSLDKVTTWFPRMQNRDWKFIRDSKKRKRPVEEDEEADENNDEQRDKMDEEGDDEEKDVKPKLVKEKAVPPAKKPKTKE